MTELSTKITSSSKIPLKNIIISTVGSIRSAARHSTIPQRLKKARISKRSGLKPKSPSSSMTSRFTFPLPTALLNLPTFLFPPLPQPKKARLSWAGITATLKRRQDSKLRKTRSSFRFLPPRQISTDIGHMTLIRKRRNSLSTPQRTR